MYISTCRITAKLRFTKLARTMRVSKSVVFRIVIVRRYDLGMTDRQTGVESPPAGDDPW